MDLAEKGVDLIGVWRCFRGWMRVVSCRGRRGAKKGVRLGKWWFAGCLNRKNLNSAKKRIGFHGKFKVLQGLIDEEVPMSTLRARARDLKPGSKKKNAQHYPL